MTTHFIGRESELEILEKQMLNPDPSFIALYGRHRIGKTETILHFCQLHSIKYIEFTGKFEQTRKAQIKSFLVQIARANPKFKKRKADDWLDAFGILREYLDELNNDKKFVIFIDELPWMDTQRSGLLSEMGDFWNTYCSRRPNIMLIVCGSAASYMLKKVIRNKGPLHGRLIRKLPMEQFDLYDTKRFLNSQGCDHYSHKAIINIYMALSGIAKYLKAVDKSMTPQQAIHDICFSKHALLK